MSNMVSLCALCLVILFLVVTVLYQRGILRFLYLVSKIRGPTLWELVTVHLRKLTTEMLTHISEQCEHYSYKPWGLWTMSGDYVVILSSLSDVSDMYQSKNLTTKPDLFYRSMANYLGKGSVVLRGGEEHRARRKLFGPAFHKSLLELNIHIISNGAKTILEELRRFADGPSINLSQIIDDTFADTVMRFFTAGKGPVLDVTDFNKLLACALKQVQHKETNPAQHWFQIRFHQPTIQDEDSIQKFLAEGKSRFKKYYEKVAIEARAAANEDPRDVFEFSVKNSLKTGIKCSDEDTSDEAITYATAAIDTTKADMKLALLLLALHQEVQQRVFDELQDIFGSSDRQATPQDLDRMEYLAMVIKETLRLFPAAPLILRKAVEETNVNGTIIPKGACVMVNIMALHRNPDNFKDPLEFIPERFLPELSEERHPFSYVPFSSGVRNCLGKRLAFMMMKYFLSSILRQYKILPAEGINGIDDLEIGFSVLLNIPRAVGRLVSRK